MTAQVHAPVAVSTHPVDTATRSSALTGSWPSVAAWGAGLVLAAVGAGAIVGPESTVLVRAVGVVVVTLGLSALFWGGIVLAKSRLVRSSWALAGVMAGLLSLFGLLLLAPARTSVFAVAAGSFLLLTVGAFCASSVRGGVDRPRDAGSARGIVGMLLAAAVIAVVVTPALGATQDALLLRDDGTLPSITHDGH